MSGRRRAQDEDTTWPDAYGAGYQIAVGSYGGLDDRVKRRTRKQPLGFAPAKKTTQRKRKR